MRLKITLRDGEDWTAPLEFELSIREVYSNCDEEFAKMHVWLAGNPEKRPVSKPKRFVANWMNRSGKMRPLSTPLSVVRAVSQDTVERTVESTEEAKAHLARMKSLIKRVA